jgi:pimeloyl-[acyl-carrier protein] methyl ester esterase
MRTIAFVHGWGFDASFWQPVADRLPDFAKSFVDFGFFGEPAQPRLDTPLIVSHSLGFAWALANLDRPWAGIVAINGFARFTRAPDFVAGTPPRLVDRMIARFADEPETVTTEFLGRCGVDHPDLSGIRPKALATALGWLAHCDERARIAALDCPLVALAGTRDPIVCDAASRDSFPPECLTLVEGAGHLLPHSHPEWVASRIRLFAASLP